MPIKSGKKKRPRRVGIYGEPGAGKTSLAAHLKMLNFNPVWIDLDEGSGDMDVSRWEPGPTSWDELRQALHHKDLKNVDTIVVDSMTRAQTLCSEWVCNNVPHEKGKSIRRIEDYGFGKGFQHIYDTFLLLVGDLDALWRQGKNIVTIMHEVIDDKPNPMGADYISYEPALQSPKSGKASIRNYVVGWLDELIFIDIEKTAGDDGKARSSGERRIYVSDQPFCKAKNRRRLDGDYPFEFGKPGILEKIFAPDGAPASKTSQTTKEKEPANA